MEEVSSDQRASILAVIAQERVTVAFYAAELGKETRPAWIARLRALQRRHKAYIKRWREELKHAPAD